MTEDRSEPLSELLPTKRGLMIQRLAQESNRPGTGEDPPPRAWTTSGVVSLREALTAAYGHILVRCGDFVGRVYMTDGEIAWIELSTDSGSLEEIFGHEEGLGKEEVQAVSRECLLTGRCPAQVILDWKLMDKAELRERIRPWVRERLERILDLEDSSALFVPEPHGFGGPEITFSLEEFLPEVAGRVVSDAGFPKPPAIFSVGGFLTDSGTLDDSRGKVCAKTLASVPGGEVCGVVDLANRRIVALARVGDSVTDRLRQCSMAGLLSLMSQSHDGGEDPLQEAYTSFNTGKCFVASVSGTALAMILVTAGSTKTGMAWIALREAILRL